MSRYRRARVPGATYFFTVNLLNRRSDLLVRHRPAPQDREPPAHAPFHLQSDPFHSLQKSALSPIQFGIA